MPNEQSQTRRFDDMRKQIDGIAAKQDATSRNVHEILAILRGDDFAEGMVSAVKDHETRIKKLESLKNKATWTILGMSIPAGYGIVDFIKEFWTKIVGAFVILLLFTSCLTQKKREDIFHRHAREVPADVLDYCPEPSVVVKPGRVDTVTNTVTHRVPYAVAGDTVWVDCPEHEVKVVSRVDTVTKKDEAEAEALRIRLADAGNALAHDRGRIEQLREQQDKDAKRIQRGWWLSVGLGVGLILSIALRFIKLI